MSETNWKTRAAFLKGGRWGWHVWTHTHANKHAALIEKAAELGAQGYDAGQADHAELSRANF
jgi:hypothetical protein